MAPNKNLPWLLIAAAALTDTWFPFKRPLRDAAVTPFLKIDSTPLTRFSADVPWAAPKALHTLSDSLHAARPRLSTNNFAPTTTTFKVAPQPAPVNNVWKQTPIGNGKIISMAGANSDVQGRPVIPGTEAVPNWKNAFESEPVGFIDFARGYVSEMWGGVDLAKTLLTHVKNTAVSMARNGEITFGFPTPQNLLKVSGDVLGKALGEPLVAAARDAAAHPDRTLNNSGDAVAKFGAEYTDNLLRNPYQTAETSFAAGAGTYLLMTMGAKDFLARLIPDAKYAQRKVSELTKTVDLKSLPDDQYAMTKVLQSTDPTSFDTRSLQTVKTMVARTPPATKESVLEQIVIFSPFASNQVTYTYKPSLKPQAGEWHKPAYEGTPLGFSEHGIRATYNPNNKTLLVNTNTERAEGSIGLNQALGDSGLMTSAVMDALRTENRRVDTIVLRPNVLQGSNSDSAQRELIAKELNQLSAIQVLQEQGYVLARYVGDGPKEVGLVFHRKLSSH